jgi:hypothetical protein
MRSVMALGALMAGPLCLKASGSKLAALICAFVLEFFTSPPLRIKSSAEASAKIGS